MKILKEPLLHFFIIGAAFFMLYAIINPEASSGDKRIDITSGRVDALAQQFRKTWNRSPNNDELQSLVESYALEEIYYRKALAMGLDQNDPVVRRRLQQKLEFFNRDIVENLQPSDTELEEYLRLHRQKYQLDNQYSFEQVFVAVDGSHADGKTLADQRLAALNAGKAVSSDTSLLPRTLNNKTQYQIDRVFGKGFSQQLDALAINRWSQPVRSGLGLHIVRLSARQSGALPELAMVRGPVKRDWIYDKHEQAKKALNQQLLQDYDIDLQWPVSVKQLADSAAVK